MTTNHPNGPFRTLQRPRKPEPFTIEYGPWPHNLCWFCGNGEPPAFARERVNYGGEVFGPGEEGHAGGYRMHTLDDDGHPTLCPPLPAGYGVCDRCLRAQPAHTPEHSGGLARGRLVRDGETVRGLIRRPLGSRDKHLRIDDPRLANATIVKDNALLCAYGFCIDHERDMTRPITTTHAPTISKVSDQARADAVPSDGAGFDVGQLMALWGLGERQTRSLARRLAHDGLLIVIEVPIPHSGTPVKRYLRAPS